MAELYTTSLFSDANLVSYWRMEGNSNDSKGTNNGTDTAITYGVDYGKYGQGALFNGTTSDIALPSNTSLNLTTAGTISAWIKPTFVGENSEGRIVHRSASGSTDGFSFRLKTNNVIEFEGLGSTTVSSSNNAITLSVWQHVAVTISSTTIRIYVNGSEVKNGTTTITTSGATAGHIGNRGAYDRTFDGSIDDVAIFSRALTDAEVLQLYKEQSGALFFSQL